MRDTCCAGARHTIDRSHPAIVVEDEFGVFDNWLDVSGFERYRKTREWPGHNDLWEWT